MSNKPLVSDEECLHCKAEPAAPKPNPKLYQRIEEDQPSSNFGKALTLAIGTAAIGIVAVTIPFVIPAFRKHALPYIPATDKQVSNAFKAIRAFNKSVAEPKYVPNKSNQVELIDLGSGDGRIVFEAAKYGYKSAGVELNSMLVLYSKFKALTSWSKLKKDIYVEPTMPVYYPCFHRADLWKFDMSKYDIIVVFGVQEMMADLASKLKKEMKPDCLIVSCRSPITEYKSIFHLDEDIDSIWIYDKQALFKPVDAENREKLSINNKAKNQDDDDDLM